MRFIFFAALIVVSLAALPKPEETWFDELLPEAQQEIKDQVFRSGREYRFHYNGQLSTGVPMASKQHSATRIQALVTLVFKSHDSCLLELSHIRFGKLNRRLPEPRRINPFHSFEEVPVREDLQTVLKKPLQFKWNKGLISDLVLDGSEQPWSANIKRGVLNMLQVNLQKSELHEPMQTLRRSSQKEDFYRAMESVLGGKCEVAYSVVEQERELLKVSKSVNFENCEKRPDIKYNFRFTTPCESCEESQYTEESKFLKSSVVINYKIKGTPESFSILETTTESQYTVVPFDPESNVILTTVAQKLELVKSGSVQSRIPEPRNPIESDSDMIYSPDWDVLKEEFHMEGEESFLRETPYTKVADKVELVERMIREFLQTMQESVSEETPKYFIRLVKIFRMLKKSELEQIFNNYYRPSHERLTPEEHQKAKQIVIDACASAATKDCIELIVEKIMSKKIDPVVGYLAIKGIHTRVRTVSKKMIEQLLKLSESPIARRYKLIRSASLLAAGSMMHSLCEINEDKLAVEFKETNPKQRFCPREVEERFSKVLFDQLKEAKTPEEMILIVKTISNAALRHFLPKIQELIYNPSTSQFLRTECIFALRQYIITSPHHVRKILMPIFMDSEKPSPLRIAALYQILETQPPRPILDQISKYIAQQKSRQVTSFYFTYMHSMANSTLPCTRRFANDIKLSLRHASFPHSFLIGHSKYINMPFYFPSQKFGLSFHYGQIFSRYGSLPRRLRLTFNPLFGGFWSKNFLSIEMHAHGLEKMLYKYLGDAGYLYEKRPEEILRRSPRSVSDPMRELKSLFTSLKTESRSPRTYEQESRVPRGHLSMLFRNQEYAYLPFNMENMEQSVREMIEEGSFNVREIERFLETGYHMRLLKSFYLHEMSYKIPTSLGLPIRFSAIAPVVIKATGKVKGDISPADSIKNIKVFFENFKPSIAVSLIFNVECWSPVVNSGFKLVSTVKVYSPHKELRAEIDLVKKEVMLAMKPVPIRSPITLVAVETTPITYTLVWPRTVSHWVPKEKKTVMGEEWNRVETIEKEFGRRTIGYNLKLRGRWHRTPTTKWSVTPFCPFSGPNRVVITTEEGLQNPTEIVLKLTGEFFQSQPSLTPSLSGFERIFTSEEERKPTGNKGLREEMTELYDDLDSLEYSAEEEENRFSYSTFKGYKPTEPKMHHIRAELFTRGGPAKRRCVLTTTIRHGKNLRYFHIESKLRVDPLPTKMPKAFEMELIGETLFPETPRSFSELVGKKHLSSFRLTFGPEDRVSVINMKVVAERSSAQAEFEKQSPYWQLFNRRSEFCNEDRDLCSPLVERQEMLSHMTPHNLRVSIDYEKVPVPMKVFINQVFRHVKHHYFYNTIVRQVGVSNPEGKIRATFTLDPYTKRYINCSVITPREAVFFRDIPTPMPIAPIKNRVEETFGPLYQPRPICSLSSRRIETFDKVEYSTKLSNCWTVLTKDCGNKDTPSFAVLVKRKTAEKEMKVVKIVTGSHKIELIPTSEDYESIKVKAIDNDMVAPESFKTIMHHGHPIVRIEKDGKHVKCELPEVGLTILFDGYTANIKVSEMYRNELCGLCGNANREVEDEFVTPELRETKDVREFFRSYTVPESSCQMPQRESICDSEECEYTPFYEDTDKIETSSEEEKSEKPIAKTRVIERMDQICFSKVPVPQCPVGSYPTEMKPSKKIAYTCMDNTSFEAREYRRRVSEENVYLRELRQSESAFSESEEIPKKCSAY